MQHLAPVLLSGMAAAGYTIAAIFVKQASLRGASVWQLMLSFHLTMMVVTFPILLAQQPALSWASLLWPFLAGLCAMLGGVFVLLALTRGDVSVATPILGLKVVIVTVLVVLLGRVAVSADLWIAALLAAAGVWLVAGGEMPHGGRRRHLMTAVISIIGSTLFALTDVILQTHVKNLGYWVFFPLMAITMGTTTILLVLVIRVPKVFVLPRNAVRPMAIGSLLMTGQAVLMSSAIAVFQAATVANVVYSSRTFLSVLAIWWLGRFFEMDEFAGRPDHLARRLIGAGLLFAGIIFVIV